MMIFRFHQKTLKTKFESTADKSISFFKVYQIGTDVIINKLPGKIFKLIHSNYPKTRNNIFCKIDAVFYNKIGKILDINLIDFLIRPLKFCVTYHSAARSLRGAQPASKTSQQILAFFSQNSEFVALILWISKDRFGFL